MFAFLLKPRKLTFSNFGNLRRKRQEDGEEYICPMELGHPSGSNSKKGFKPGLDMRLYDEDDLDRLEQVKAIGHACFLSSSSSHETLNGNLLHCVY